MEKLSNPQVTIETIKKLPPMYFTNITGGEPFIREDLKDIVRELYKKSDRIVISTNGFFTDRIIDLCKEFPNIGIRISIEGLEQTNNEIRGLDDGYQTMFDCHYNDMVYWKLRHRNGNIISIKLDLVDGIITQCTNGKQTHTEEVC